jgi:hypothetical protein
MAAARKRAAAAAAELQSLETAVANKAQEASRDTAVVVAQFIFESLLYHSPGFNLLSLIEQAPPAADEARRNEAQQASFRLRDLVTLDLEAPEDASEGDHGHHGGTGVGGDQEAGARGGGDQEP